MKHTHPFVPDMADCKMVVQTAGVTCRAKRYVPRVRTGRVRDHDFYRTADAQFQKTAADEAAFLTKIYDDYK